MATADVEIDIFSGRPNPTWTLSDTQTASLLEMVGGLPQSEAGAAPDHLGYRGMIVRLHNAAAREVAVHNGVVVVNGTSHTDPERRVERWLLETGRGSVEQSTYDFVEGEL